jgi:hypothetical protein
MTMLADLISHDRASVYQWFIDLGTHPNIITDVMVQHESSKT